MHQSSRNIIRDNHQPQTQEFNTQLYNNNFYKTIHSTHIHFINGLESNPSVANKSLESNKSE